jgi:hypothetical protein
MSEYLRTLQDYELYLYTLPDRFPCVRSSTVTLVRLGATLARVAGEVLFGQGFRLVVRERLVYDRLPVAIEWYGYEIWRDIEKLYWYDSQPHPHDPHLQSTHPHHRHEPPDAKRNRVPAAGFSFTRPNLALLVAEIEALLEQASGKPQ